MKYLSLVLCCYALSACSSDIKNQNTIFESLASESLACHNTIPEWQLEELSQVPCLTLPISNRDFLDIKKFNNGMLDVEGDEKYPKSQNYYRRILLGIIPYSDNQGFLLTLNNDQAEDGYPNQSFHIIEIAKDNNKETFYSLGIHPLGLINYDFKESELTKLGIDPNEFANIDFNTLGKENIRIDDTCMMNFNIDTDWSLTRSYSCQNSQADQETIDSFKEQFGFNYKLVDNNTGVSYERVD